MVSIPGSSTSTQSTSFASETFRWRFDKPRAPITKHGSSSLPTPAYRIHERRMAFRRFGPGARGPESTPASTRNAEVDVLKDADAAPAPQDKQRQEKSDMSRSGCRPPLFTFTFEGIDWESWKSKNPPAQNLVRRGIRSDPFQSFPSRLHYTQYGGCSRVIPVRAAALGRHTDTDHIHTDHRPHRSQSYTRLNQSSR